MTFDLNVFAAKRRERVETRSLMIASQVPDGHTVHVRDAEYRVTTARGRISADLAADPGFLEPATPVLVRDGVSLTDLAARIPVPDEFSYIEDLNPEDGAPGTLSKLDDATVEAAALELDEVEQAFVPVVDEAGRRGADTEGLPPGLRRGENGGLELC